MATLVSPGVSITVTDESFGTGTGPGTVPLIILATAQDKLNASGDDIASGTLKQNAKKLYLLSSQRELLQTFGTPNFNSVGGSALHGYPLNEYGLLAAHSYLGIANRVFCVRADVNLDELQPSDFAPIAPPKAGTYWLNPANVDPAVYEYVGTKWIKQTVFIHTGDVDTGVNPGSPINAMELSSANYVLVAGRREVGGTIYENQLWKKIAGVWTMIDDNYFADFQYADVWPVGTVGDVWVNTRAAKYEIGVYSETSGEFVVSTLPLFATTADAKAFFVSPKAGDMFIQYDTRAVNTDGTLSNAYGDGARQLIKRHNGKTSTQFISTHNFTAGPMSVSVDINGTPVTIASAATAQAAADTINTAFGNTGNVAASVISGKLAVTDVVGDDITFEVTAGTLAGMATGTTVVSNWAPLSYEFDVTEPAGDLADGTLWYSSEFKVDLLQKVAGVWTTKDAAVQTSAPETPSAGDVWVDTDQIEDYPVIYKYDGASWVKVDNTDQTTPDGIIFADARVDADSALDADAPDPFMYPDGMLLWNTRYSTRVVKEYYSNYVFEGNEIGPRWVLKSGTDFDGSLVTGNAAIKKVVTQAMAAAIVDNDDIRSEFVFYNLIAAPGFPELIDEMVSLNIDKKELAFVIGDTPMTLKPDSTSLNEWATNANLSPTNGDDGLITRNEYLGVYYPSGLATNLDGTEVVVPPSHMMLRTMAYNDQVAYPWFAPAGLQRGVVNNAVSVGYIDDEGEYVAVALNQGQRDILYSNDINPIKMDPNSGVVVWGQKTRYAIDTSALSRVNVARLINYIRYQLEVIVQPFFFQPNDAKTRGSVKTIIDSFLGELVSLRGLTDFLVVCDSSNNTGARIDRNELWIDIAIVPTKAVEFIYIPIRIKGTGSDLGA